MSEVARHIKFPILENLLKKYENGDLGDLHFMLMVATVVGEYEGKDLYEIK